MFVQVYEVDENGFYKDVLSIPEENITDDMITKGWGNKGLFSPKWDYEIQDWVEGKSNEAILNTKRYKKFEELRQACEQDILGYFEVTINDTLYKFSFDREAQDNFNGYANLFNKGLVTQAEWTAWVKNKAHRIILSEEEFWMVCMKAFEHKDSKISRLRDEIQTKIDDAKTLDELELITW